MNYDGLESLIGPWTQQPSAASQRIFLGVGERETETLIADIYRLAGTLRDHAPEGVVIETCTLPDETHMTSWGPLYTRGLTSTIGTQVALRSHHGDVPD